MKIAILLLVFILGFIAYIRYVEVKTMFVPSRAIQWTPAELGLVFEDIYFFAKDGTRLNGWFIKAEGNSKETGTLLFLHGNAGNISGRLEKIGLFHGMGINVFIIDYRGYGRSAGKPSEAGMCADAQAAYDYLLTREDIDPEKIIGYGVSLGGAAAIDLALKRKLSCLIIDSTFTSAKDMAKQIVPFVPPVLVQSNLKNLSKIKKIKVPLLIIHSTDDEVIPFEFGRQLFAAAPYPKNFLQITGSHNEGFLESQEKYRQGILAFIFNLFLLEEKPHK